MASLFGFSIIRDEDKKKDLPTFVPKSDDEGAMLIAPGGSYGQYVDVEGTAKNDVELITKYRELAKEAELEYAIDEIVNEAIATDENDVVSINTDNIEGYSEGMKKKIHDEFDKIKELFNINNIAYELFRRWYIDGRLFYHVIIDEKNPTEGIQELRYIDPRKIKKVIEIQKNKRDTEKPSVITKNEYYLFSEKGFGAKTNVNVGDYNVKAVQISKDSIIQANSGLMDENNKFILSYLHKALRPWNQLRSLENSLIIYRLARAPERRVFYIDVGNLPRAKAEQYLRDMMVKHKNKLVYDSNTGEVRDGRSHMTMMEDYWFPRNAAGKSTEVTTLPGGQNLGELADLDYFLQKLYKALNIPVSRLNPSEGFNIGRPSEITRDEIKFQKFITRLRRRFSHLFYSALEKQLILKNIILPEEWESIKNNIVFEFAVDNHFTEMKNQDVMMSRVDLADRYMPYLGQFISKKFMQKEIFNFSDDDIDRIANENKDDPVKPEDLGLGLGPQNNPQDTK